MAPATPAAMAAATTSSGNGSPARRAKMAAKAPTARKAELPIETCPAVPINTLREMAPIAASRQLLKVNRLADEPLVVKYNVNRARQAMPANNGGTRKRGARTAGAGAAGSVVTATPVADGAVRTVVIRDTVIPSPLAWSRTARGGTSA